MTIRPALPFKAELTQQHGFTLSTGEVNAVAGGQEKLIANMQATMMGLRDREGLSG